MDIYFINIHSSLGLCYVTGRKMTEIIKTYEINFYSFLYFHQGARRRAGAARTGAGRAAEDRQGEGKGGARAGGALGPDAPAVQLHQLLDNRQPQPGPAGGPRPRAVGPPESLEHVGQVGGSDAAAGIAHL